MAESMSDLAAVICEKIRSVFSKATQDGLESDSGPYPDALEVAVEEISAAVNRKGRVFVFGAGREGLMMKALCMRLAHLGISAHCVGDVTTPPISTPDLLLASAGTGGVPTVDAICGIARSAGARVLFFTSRPKTGSACRFATAIAFLPAQTMADGGAESGDQDGVVLLPMGSVYEGAMFVLFEMVVFRLGGVLGQTRQAITSRPKTWFACRFATAFLHAQTMADGGAESGDEFGVVLLPMGSVYEGAKFVLFRLFEMVVFRLGRALGQTLQAIASRHTNLE